MGHLSHIYILILCIYGTVIFYFEFFKSSISNVALIETFYGRCGYKYTYTLHLSWTILDARHSFSLFYMSLQKYRFFKHSIHILLIFWINSNFVLGFFFYRNGLFVIVWKDCFHEDLDNMYTMLLINFQNTGWKHYFHWIKNKSVIVFISSWSSFL